MLLEFSVRNSRSFKEEVVLSMYALEMIEGYENNNLYPVSEQNILKIAVIYGANASSIC